MQQQVDEGRIETIDKADRHWYSRERSNQIAAWTSFQSEQLDSKDALLQRVKEVKTQFRDEHIPRPAHWRGYRLLPNRIEFWKAGWHRLHERVRYDYTNGAWHKTMLNS